MLKIIKDCLSLSFKDVVIDLKKMGYNINAVRIGNEVYFRVTKKGCTFGEYRTDKALKLAMPYFISCYIKRRKMIYYSENFLFKAEEINRKARERRHKQRNK